MKKTSSKEIGEFRSWVKGKREELGMTQLELATKAGLGRGTVGGIESGANVVGKKARQALIQALGGAGGVVQQNGSTNHNETHHYHVGAKDLSVSALSQTVAALLVDPDFEARIESMMKALKCDRKKAVEVLVKEELSK